MCIGSRPEGPVGQGRRREFEWYLLVSASGSKTDCASKLALEPLHMEEESLEVEGGEGRGGANSEDCCLCMEAGVKLGMGGEALLSGGVGRL